MTENKNKVIESQLMKILANFVMSSSYYIFHEVQQYLEWDFRSFV